MQFKDVLIQFGLMYKTLKDNLSVINDIIYELQVIEVKIDDETKALRLILLFSPSYECMKLILIYEKKILDFAKISSKLLIEE